MTQTNQPCDTPAITHRLAQADRLWLFLDYDGTLADLAPTPEHVYPDAEVATLVSRLATHPRIRVTIISGRRLNHVEKLVPVPDILLAGTYGVELRTPAGAREDRLDYSTIRPTFDAIKPRWATLLAEREGFFLEDKGWALAIHARFADEAETEEVLAAARRIAEDTIAGEAPGVFRLLGGHKFLEIGPTLAHKGRTVEYLLDRYAWPGALLVYLGDDDKDEEAFEVIKEKGGLAIVVAPQPRPTLADCRLDSPQAARHWLHTLPARLGA